MSSYTLQLSGAMEEANRMGISPQLVYDQLVQDGRIHGCTRLASSQFARGKLQNMLQEALLEHPANKFNYEERVRHKLKVWKLPTPKGVLSRRFISRYCRLSQLVQPRVHAACWRSAFNGWCVDHRFRNLEGRSWTKQCIFKCTLSSEDRIEHYHQCPYVLRFARQYLNIAPASCNLTRFLLVDDSMTDTDLIVHAILVYAVYRAQGSTRHKHALTEAQVFDMLEGFAKTAVHGHSKSAAALFKVSRGRFIPPHAPSVS